MSRSGLLTRLFMLSGCILTSHSPSWSAPAAGGGLPASSYHWEPAAGVDPSGMPLSRTQSSIPHHSHGSKFFNSPIAQQSYPGLDPMQQFRSGRGGRNSSMGNANYNGANYSGGRGHHHHHHQHGHFSAPSYGGSGSANGASGSYFDPQYVLGRQHSALQLQRELNEPPSYMKGIRLVPQGTNLYVRNYETFHSYNDDRNNAIPLIAVPKKLSDVPNTYPQGR